MQFNKKVFFIMYLPIFKKFSHKFSALVSAKSTSKIQAFIAVMDDAYVL